MAALLPFMHALTLFMAALLPFMAAILPFSLALLLFAGAVLPFMAAAALTFFWHACAALDRGALLPEPCGLFGAAPPG
eukprot:3536714-Rhodomonas_salina.2